MDNKRDPYQRIIPCVLAAMAVIFAIWTAASHLHKGVAFYDTLLTISEEGGQTVYRGKLFGDAVTITCAEENGTKLVDFSAPGHYRADCRVEYPTGTITTEYGKRVPRIRILRNDEVLFSGGYDPAPDGNRYMRFYRADGTWEPLISVGASGGGDPWYYFEFDAQDILRFAGEPATSVRGSWIWYFVLLFGSLIAALETVFRDEIFYLSHFLHVRDPEPTEYYYAAHRIGSVIAVIFLLICYIKGVFTIV